MVFKDRSKIKTNRSQIDENQRDDAIINIYSNLSKL